MDYRKCRRPGGYIGKPTRYDFLAKSLMKITLRPSEGFPPVANSGPLNCLNWKVSESRKVLVCLKISMKRVCVLRPLVQLLEKGLYLAFSNLDRDSIEKKALVPGLWSIAFMAELGSWVEALVQSHKYFPMLWSEDTNVNTEAGYSKKISTWYW